MGERAEQLSLKGLRFAATEISEEGNILTITLNRPDRKNAINQDMTHEMIYALDYAKQERNIRAVVIAAKGDVFCAGADLSTMRGGGKSLSNVPKRGETDDISLRIRHLEKPVIAKIQGSVYAGALLFVCNSTHAVAADHAQFSAPEILRGIWPFMVMAGLFRVMPKRVGLDFIMRGKRLSAEEAQNHGLINDAVPAEVLDAHVASLAKEMASLAPGTMRLGLHAYNAQEDMDFNAALPFLRKQLEACLKSADAKEGITAFLEKRKPNWD